VIVPVRGVGALALLFRGLEDRRPLVLVLVYLLVTVAMDALESFGIEERNDAAAANALGVALSPFYGGLERQGQSRISVVTVDRRTVESSGGNFWPLPYAAQLELAERILAGRPAVLFIDFSYPQVQFSARPGENTMLALVRANEEARAFAEALHALSVEHAVPIMIGPVGDAPGLDRLRDLFPPLSPGRAGSGQVGLSVRERPSFAYPHRDGAGGVSGRSQAAFALYAALCAASPPDDCRVAPDRINAEFTGRDLSVAWGFGGPKEMGPLQSASERDRCLADGFFDRLRLVGEALWRGLFHAVVADDVVAPRCTYHLTVNAAALLAADMSAPATDLDDRDLISFDTLFAGRAVLLGADIADLADFFETPVYGYRPGVTVHAMALDNLIENGASAWRNPGDVFLGIDAADLTEILLLLGAVLAIYGVAHLRSSGDAVTSPTQWGGYLLVICVTSAFAFAIGTWRHWPPLNIVLMLITLVGAAALIEAVCRSRLAAEQRRRLVDPGSEQGETRG